jgi:hypothetical protein
MASRVAERFGGVGEARLDRKAVIGTSIGVGHFSGVRRGLFGVTGAVKINVGMACPRMGGRSMLPNFVPHGNIWATKNRGF